MQETVWWKRGVIYQIYPRSFQDSNADGIGDLDGIRRRLDHLVWLGVDAVWISPVYPSPMADFGYDVADYCDIDPNFGNLEHFRALITEIHERGLKLIMDFVPNHSSDQHAWFKESRSSRDNPKRDWYIWRDAAPGGGPPNNWVSNFGGSAWQWDEATGQYYYHAFLREQPDLNWRNREVCEAMHDVLRFWLDLGVDGFRVDVIWHLMKDEQFRDNPPNPAYVDGRPEIESLLQIHSTDQPDVHDVIARMRHVLDGYKDRVLIGEVYLPIDRLVTYYGRELAGAHLPFNFQLLQTAWHAGRIAELIDEYEGSIPDGGWPNWVLGNHDQPRVAARVGEDQARVAAMLLLTLRGTPTLYYGDEIGIGRVAIPAHAVQDPWEKNEPGLGIGRDPQRTPMQWDASAKAGFTEGTPWLPLSEDHRTRNVAVQASDPTSMLTLTRALIMLRRRSPALSIGAYALLNAKGDVLAYERRCGHDRYMIVLNLGGKEELWNLPENVTGEIVLSTTLGGADQDVADEIRLRPDEGIVIQCHR
ncbi:MAG: alpha-amylase [Hyphomicrobiales bacterium]|nr:alpha-amylase [Hyphomicrobiales bacterium]